MGFFRLEDYIDVVSGSGDPDKVDELASNIIEITNNIISTQPPDEIVDDIYGVLEELEVLLSCSLNCGERSREYLVCLFCFFCEERQKFGFTNKPR